MNKPAIAAIVAPALAVAGMYGLLAFDPVRTVRDRILHAGLNARADAEVANLYLDPLTQETSRGANPLASLRRLDSAWCGASERVRYVLMGNSQTMAMVLAPSEWPQAARDKTYPDLVLDALRSSGASVRGYRLSAPNINYMEALWYLTYLLEHPCLTPTDLVLQLNFETFRKTGIRDSMLELLDDASFAGAVDADASASAPYAATLRQAIDRRRTRVETTTVGTDAALEARVRTVLDRDPTFQHRRDVKSEFVNSIYLARIRLLHITTSTKRSIPAATLSLNESALERIGDLCRMHGIRLTLFNAPQNPLVPLYESDAERTSYHAIIAGIERRYGWRSFDFEDSIPAALWGVWIDGPDPIHLGRAGHRRLADLFMNAGVVPRN